MKIPDLDDPILSSSQYLDFEKSCLRIGFPNQSNDLLQQGLFFAQETQQVSSVVDAYKRNIASVPFLSIVFLWAQHVLKDKIMSSYQLDLMKELIESDILSIQKNKSTFSTLKDYVHMGHAVIIDNIRAHQDWYIKKREDVVLFYNSFGNWLSQNSFEYVPMVIDPDRKMAERRKFPFEKYVELLSNLPERERILTKLYYLGGERAMEEVLSLKVSDIDFINQQIQFSEYPVGYPKHVLEDIKAFIGARRSGFVFTKKKNNERVVHTVTYRALKKAAEKLKLPENFSYKDLVREF